MLAFPPTPQTRMGPGLRRDDVRGAHLKRLLCTAEARRLASHPPPCNTPPRPRGSARLNNQLYYGDNLDVLRRNVASASVDLCYIDLPFNSKRNYSQIYNNQGSEDRTQAQAFVDTWNWGIGLG